MNLSPFNFINLHHLSHACTLITQPTTTTDNVLYRTPEGTAIGLVHTLTLSRAAGSSLYSSTASRTTSGCPPWAAWCSMLKPPWLVSWSNDSIFVARYLMICTWPPSAALCRAFRPCYNNGRITSEHNNPVAHTLRGLISEYMSGSGLCLYNEWQEVNMQTCTFTQWSHSAAGN